MAEGPSDTTSDDGVLAGLPSTRPNRIGGRARRGEPAAPRRSAAAGAKAKPRAKASTKRAAAKPNAGAKRAAAKAKAAETVAPKPTPIADGRKPRPVRAGHPGLDGAAENRPERAPQPDGPGLVGGVAQAAGDVATVGIKLGGRLVKGVAKKLPRP